MPIGPAPSGGGAKAGGSTVGPAPTGGIGPAPSGGSPAAPDHSGLLGGKAGGLTGLKRFFTDIRHARNPTADAIGVIGRPAEAVQAGLGFQSTSGAEDRGRLHNVLSALGGTSTYGIQGDGALNTVGNFGLDLVTDPTVFLSGGTKAANFGSRLLTEGGAADLAKIAATRGLTEAEQGVAKGVIRQGIEAGGAGALAKRSLADNLLHRSPGLSGTELAVDRATEGLVKEGRGGIRFAGKTILPGETIQKVAAKVPGLDVAGDAFRNLVVPRAGVTRAFGKDTSSILNMATSKASGELEAHINNVVAPLKREIKAAKITEEDLKGPLLSHLETGTPVEPRLQPMADAMRSLTAEDTAKIVERHLLPEEFLHTETGYVPRIPTDAGFRAIGQAERKGQLPGELSSLFKVAGSLEARKILPNATIPEAEAVVQEMLAKVGVKMKAGETFYEHNPLKAVVSHSAAVERASGQAGVLEHLAGLPDGPSMVVLADSPTVKAPSVTEDIAKTRSKIETARRNVARAEGRLAQEGPTRPLNPAAQAERDALNAQRGRALGPEQMQMDPVERLKVTQRLHDHQAALQGHRDNLAALMEQKKAGGAANAAADAARKPPEGFEAIKMGERTAYVHPELAREINGVSRLVNNAESVTRLGRHIDEVQNFWRAQVTVMPLGSAFFARNFQGNILLNAVDHVGLRDYGVAARIQKGVAKAGKLGVDAEKVLSAEDARIFRASETHNVYNRGAQEADLNHVFPGDDVGSFKGKTSALRLNGDGATLKNIPIVGTERGPIGFGRDVNAVIENNARLANFIANGRKTGSFEEAARITRTTLFDYGDLTDFERKYARRLIPFYTFARKSTGALLREMAHNPAQLNRILHTTGLVEDLSGRGIDSPYDSAAKTLLTPVIPGQAKNMLGVGGYLGAAKQQILGTTIQDRKTGGFTTIDPNAPQSESRLERLGNALLPEYGKFGRVERGLQKALPGDKQDLLRLLLGLSPGDDPVARTPGGGQVLQSTTKKAPGTAKAAPKRTGGLGPAPR